MTGMVLFLQDEEMSEAIKDEADTPTGNIHINQANISNLADNKSLFFKVLYTVFYVKNVMDCLRKY